MSQGVKLPLEVFKTRAKGFGVRCAEDIPAGAFVCAYVGELVTEAMVQELEEGQDLYLFSLDHFMHIFKVCISGSPLNSMRDKNIQLADTHEVQFAVNVFKPPVIST